MKQLINLTEYNNNHIVNEGVELLSERQEMIVEMARINKKETGNSIFPFDKWEVKIWSNDHYPPHFHIIYDRWDVSFLIETGEMLECKGNGSLASYNYMLNNVKRWLTADCAVYPKITNQENAMLIWEQLH